jgi:hypothetical protein
VSRLRRERPGEANFFIVHDQDRPPVVRRDLLRPGGALRITALLHRRRLPPALATRSSDMMNKESIDLEPMYTTSNLPGRCLKCLAEEKLNTCLLELLRGGGDDEQLARRFEALVTFLKSPESKKLRDESEKYLSEGKQVSVRIDFVDGKLKYELELKE